MNKVLVLKWLLQDAAENGDRHYKRRIKLEDTLKQLNNWKENPLPASLPKSSEEAITVLRDHFKDNVTFISFVLSQRFPEKYVYYRVSKLEEEIFEGLDFFSEVVPEFKKLDHRVTKTGFNRYLKLNGILLEFARNRWPKHRKVQKKLMYFLYEGLGRLFLEKSAYSRYWIMATKPEYFAHLETRYDVEWSGRKEIRSGDLVFMYRTSPRKAIADIYRVKDEPVFDPWADWDGFEVNLEKVCAINDISFAEMSKDPILKQWGLVRRRFVGTVTEPVPYIIYNRLLEKISDETRKKHHLEFEPTQPQKAAGIKLPTLATPERSGQFTSETEFEDKIIVPLMRQWGFEYRRQHPCHFQVGSQYTRGRVDFYVRDERGLLTLFENKLRILKDEELKPAVEQAKSYALLLGSPSFVVASPEGMWLYSLERNEAILVKGSAVDELKDLNRVDGFKRLLLSLRQ